MRTQAKTANRRGAFTLIELLVVVSIILVIAALAAAFAPRVSDSQNLTRAVDQLEQWLLTAKMRAKRDQLATGIRFIPDPNNPGKYSEFQYIQQPDNFTGGILTSAASGTVTFNTAVDFTLGGIPASQWLVQPGDYLEVRGGGGVYLIAGATGARTLQLAGSAYDTSLNISVAAGTSTSNYRILRQPRILIGEAPLQLPNNMAVDMGFTGVVVPGRAIAGAPPSLPGFPTGGYYEILFAPSGAVIGPGAGSGKIMMYVHDINQSPPDPNRAGIVAVQTRTGFIGAYEVAPGADPFFYAETGRDSGL